MTNLPPLPDSAIPPSDLVPAVTGVFGPLFTADQMREYGEACAKAAVPEGWKLVPTKLTSAMFFAWSGTKVFDDGLPHEQYQACYRAMLNAAPTPGETK